MHSELLQQEPSVVIYVRITRLADHTSIHWYHSQMWIEVSQKHMDLLVLIFHRASLVSSTNFSCTALEFLWRIAVSNTGSRVTTTTSKPWWPVYEYTIPGNWSKTSSLVALPLP